MHPNLITFLSDYGLRDEFVGVCRGVIARRCPQARVIDITHGVPAFDVRAGAAMLAGALPFMPPAVHLAVVDPGVGAEGQDARRAIALRAASEGRLLVGPDNGLLIAAAVLLGGVVEAVDIGKSEECLRPVSRTFHGRDVFAPVAAALAAGRELASVGEPLEVSSLRELKAAGARVERGVLLAHVLRSDGFGNLILDASPAQLEEIGVRVGGRAWLQAGEPAHAATRANTFGELDAGGLLLYEDATGAVAVAVNRGSAAALLKLAPDAELVLGPA